MQAVTATKTLYHPRGSGPPYGTQFKRLRDAWWRIHGYGSPIHWVINGDVEYEMYLWCDTERKQNGTCEVLVVDDVTHSQDAVGTRLRRVAQDAWYGLTTDNKDRGRAWDVSVFGPGIVITCDELIKTWWKYEGQYAPHPWDPNGIVEARRLGLKRTADEPNWWDGDERWAGYHESDELSFKAFDDGEFERYSQEEVWNRVNSCGMRWDTAT